MMESSKGPLTLALVAALALCACGGSEPSPAPPATAAPATAAAAPAATLPAASGAATGAAGEFGVPECDRYMQKYRACLDSKVPEASRQLMRQAFEQTAAAWRQAAATPQGKAGLAAACTQQEAIAKQSMQAYGCTW